MRQLFPLAILLPKTNTINAFCFSPCNRPIYLPAFLADCKAQALKAGLKGPQAEVRSMIPRLIRSGRQALCLQSFFTAGPKEVRAWTIMKGTTAPQAAGVIHTDFERGFIKAEVCAFSDFKALHKGEASMAKIKEAGKYRQEGKQYVMADGDIVGTWNYIRSLFSTVLLLVYDLGCLVVMLVVMLIKIFFSPYNFSIHAQHDNCKEKIEILKFCKNVNLKE